MTESPTLDRWVEHAKAAWRRIYREAVEQGDERRARYAAWVIRDVLGEELDG